MLWHGVHYCKIIFFHDVFFWCSRRGIRGYTKIQNDAPRLSTVMIKGYENPNLDKMGRFSTKKIIVIVDTHLNKVKLSLLLI
jgi:hypothetical protein